MLSDHPKMPPAPSSVVSGDRGQSADIASSVGCEGEHGGEQQLPAGTAGSVSGMFLQEVHRQVQVMHMHSQAPPANRQCV